GDDGRGHLGPGDDRGDGEYAGGADGDGEEGGRHSGGRWDVGDDQYESRRVRGRGGREAGAARVAAARGRGGDGGVFRGRHGRDGEYPGAGGDECRAAQSAGGAADAASFGGLYVRGQRAVGAVHRYVDRRADVAALAVRRRAGEHRGKAEARLCGGECVYGHPDGPQLGGGEQQE